jgi:hypothetical protein
MEALLCGTLSLLSQRTVIAATGGRISALECHLYIQGITIGCHYGI